MGFQISPSMLSVSNKTKDEDGGSRITEPPAMFKNHPFGFLIALLLIPTGIDIVVLLIWYLKCRRAARSKT